MSCSFFEVCEAPLCPEDRSKDYCIWYPDEEICRSRKYSSLLWVRRQKQLSKLRLPTDRYFSVQMLCSIQRVTKTLTGADPDKEGSEERWLNLRRKSK